MSELAERIAIVGCSQTKAVHRCRAVQMYTGQYFRACMDAARSIAPGQVYILSAKYGLVGPGEVIDPYDLRLGQYGSVDAEHVRYQADACQLLACRVTALCGAGYADLIEAAWPDGHVDRPLAHLSIGQQLHLLGEMRAGRAAPGPG
jgi:hypothetical protein